MEYQVTLKFCPADPGGIPGTFGFARNRTAVTLGFSIESLNFDSAGWMFIETSLTAQVNRFLTAKANLMYFVGKKRWVLKGG